MKYIYRLSLKTAILKYFYRLSLKTVILKYIYRFSLKTVILSGQIYIPGTRDIPGDLVFILTARYIASALYHIVCIALLLCGVMKTEYDTVRRLEYSGKYIGKHNQITDIIMSPECSYQII